MIRFGDGSTSSYIPGQACWINPLPLIYLFPFRRVTWFQHLSTSKFDTAVKPQLKTLHGNFDTARQWICRSAWSVKPQSVDTKRWLMMVWGKTNKDETCSCWQKRLRVSDCFFASSWSKRYRLSWPPPEVVGFVGMALWHSLFVLDPLDGIMFYYMSVDFCSINVDINKLLHLFCVGFSVRHTGPRCLVATFRKNSGLTSFWAKSVWTLWMTKKTLRRTHFEFPERGLRIEPQLPWDPSIKNERCWDFWHIF